jgi:hypothetical protein
VTRTPAPFAAPDFLSRSVEQPPDGGPPPAPSGITEPATVTADTLVAPTNDCIDLGNGIGQTRWSLVSCEVTAAVGPPPQPPSVLPVTGSNADIAANAVVLIVAGLALIHYSRRSAPK